MLLYVQCGTVMGQPKVNYVDRPLAVSIFSNVAPFEKSLDTPALVHPRAHLLQSSLSVRGGPSAADWYAPCSQGISTHRWALCHIPFKAIVGVFVYLLEYFI